MKIIGRPPIGERAMTGAERQRRYYAKKQAEIAALKAENARLRAAVEQRRRKREAASKAAVNTSAATG